MTCEKTKFVEQLRDVHKNSEIWITGAGKSLDDFSKDFFDDKIHIALNGSIYKYPNCTYWHGHHEVWREYLRDEKPEFLEKSIICYPFPGPFFHGRILKPEEFFKELTSIPYWLYFLDSTVMAKREIENPINEIINKKERISFRACQTVLHIGIEIAFLMGAKKIILAGCENRRFGKELSHADIGIPYPWGVPWEEKPLVGITTKWLAEILSEHNVELIKYYNSDTMFYKKGYEII